MDAPRTIILASLLLATTLGAAPAAAQPPSFLTFESGPVRPLALSPSRNLLFVCNTPDARLEIFDVRGGRLRHLSSVPVGLEPVAVAARTNREVWVVNHLSDSVSIVDAGADPPRVVRTLLVGDEPRDVVFARPAGGVWRAFVTTAHRGQHRSHPSLAGVRGAGDPRLTTSGVDRADVWVFDATAPGPGPGGRPLAIVELFGDTPRALAASPDGRTVYAAVFLSGNQTATVPEAAVCDGFRPTDEADACPGEFPGSPGGNPGPATNHAGMPAPEVGLVVKYDRAAAEWRDELGRDWSGALRFDLPDLDVFALDAATLETRATYPHVGTVLFNMAINPATGTLYVSNTEARNEVRFEGPGRFGGSTVQGRLHEARITVIDGGAVRPRHLNGHVDYSRRPAPASTRKHSLSTPLGMAVSDDGTTLYVAAFGSGKVGVFPTADLEAGTVDPRRLSGGYLPVSGGGPSGLALDDRRGRLYVATRFDNGVSLVDLRTGREVEHVTLPNPEPPEVTAGRPLLYDAVATSSNGEASCASCHVFGDLDGLAWDLGDPDGDLGRSPIPIILEIAAFFFPRPVNGTGDTRDFHPMKGPMTTQTLRGLENSGAMHWRGDRADGFFGRAAFDSDLSFRNFIVAFPGLLGRAARPSNAEMRSFTDFALRMVLPPSPVRALDNSLTAAEQAGRDFFIGPRRSDGAPFPLPGNTCEDCHALNPAAGHFGTEGDQSFEGETQIMKVPHLRNLYQKVGMFGLPETGFVNPGDNGHQGAQVRGTGYLHDGSIDTLTRFFEAEAFNEDPTGLVGFRNDADRRNMVEFMLAFDTDLAPIVGAQVTLDAANAAAASPRVDLLLARAGAPFVSKVLGGRVTECDLVVKGTVGGEARGGLYDPATATFLTDREADAPLTDAEVRGLASVPGQALTFTCAPPGSGRRMAIDRDLDGFRDRDELDAGSDPADPLSVPSPSPDVAVDFTSRNFGDVQVGTASPTRGVTVTNAGTRPLRIGAIAIRGAQRAEYRLVAGRDGCSRQTLQPSASCRFLVRFEPASAGLRKAIAVVPSNDPDEPEVQVALRGTGT